MLDKVIDGMLYMCSQPMATKKGTTPSSVTPRSVVIAALEYLRSVSPNADQISSVRVEEVQENPDKIWSVTLSYDAVGEFPFERKREYKDFRVGKDGKVLSMKIRPIEK